MTSSKHIHKASWRAASSSASEVGEPVVTEPVAAPAARASRPSEPRYSRP